MCASKKELLQNVDFAQPGPNVCHLEISPIQLVDGQRFCPTGRCIRCRGLIGYDPEDAERNLKVVSEDQVPDSHTSSIGKVVCERCARCKQH